MRALEKDFILKTGGDFLRQSCWIRFIKGIAISIRAGQMKAARHQWFVIDPKAVIAIDRGAPKMRAVIPFFQRKEFGTGGFVAQSGILAR